MTIEASQYINQLNSSFPRSTDLLKEGDDHIRMIKANLKSTFPNFTGSVKISSDEMNNFKNAVTLTPTGITFIKPVSVAANVGGINAGGNKITNVGNPSANTDVVNMRWIIDTIYPINSIYLSAGTQNPGTFLPGTTWTQVSQGRFLIGAGGDGVSTWGVPAGQPSGTLGFTISSSNLPQHSHSMNHSHTASTSLVAAPTHTHGTFITGITGQSYPNGQNAWGGGIHTLRAADYVTGGYAPRTSSDGGHNHTATTSVSALSANTGLGGGAASPALVNYIPNCYGVTVWRRTA